MPATLRFSSSRSLSAAERVCGQRQCMLTHLHARLFSVSVSVSVLRFLLRVGGHAHVLAAGTPRRPRSARHSVAAFPLGGRGTGSSWSHTACTIVVCDHAARWHAHLRIYIMRICAHTIARLRHRGVARQGPLRGGVPSRCQRDVRDANVRQDTHARIHTTIVKNSCELDSHMMTWRAQSRVSILFCFRCSCDASGKLVWTSKLGERRLCHTCRIAHAWAYE